MGGGSRTRVGDSRGTASAVALRPLLTFARSCGVDGDAILRDVGIRADLLDDYDHRISEADRCRVWIAVSQQMKDPYLGLHHGASVPLGAYDALDYAASLSTTFGDALDRVVRFHRILCDAWDVAKEIDGETVRFRRLKRTPPLEAEAFPAVLVARGRMVAGADFSPQEVRFAHESHAALKPYTAFFRCPVRHGCTSTEVSFRAIDLARPASGANPGLSGVLDRYMTSMLGRLPHREPFVESVHEAVARLIKDGHRPRLASVAAKLRTSPRTLQRRLEEHDTTYFAVVEEVRRALGERLVADRRLSLSEIAFLLGFSDISGFRRAYKAWTGHNPSAARVRKVSRELRP